MIDPTAAGHGWFVDLTPEDGAEFLVAGDGAMAARPGGPADGRVDLLTVIAHELGHALGLDHAVDPDDVLAPTLAPGWRALPDREDIGTAPNPLRRPSGARPALIDWHAAGFRSARGDGTVPGEAGLLGLFARDFWGKVRGQANQLLPGLRSTLTPESTGPGGNASSRIEWEGVATHDRPLARRRTR
jgi:hypothetical protein